MVRFCKVTVALSSAFRVQCSASVSSHCEVQRLTCEWHRVWCLGRISADGEPSPGVRAPQWRRREFFFEAGRVRA
jgi:hypothetical protein